MRKKKDVKTKITTVKTKIMAEEEMEKQFGPFGPARDAAEQLRQWDAGQSIWSIEMGGLGPGYEQAIQILAIETVRDWLDKPVPEKIRAFEFTEATVARLDYKQTDGSYACGGFSGAQVGAAGALAYDWLKNGPAKTKEKYGQDRSILVSKFWPKAPEVPHV